MKKSISALIFVAILMMSLCSCKGSSTHDNYKEIYKRYNDMGSFSATAEITFNNGQTSASYTVKQLYKAPKSFALTVISPKNSAGFGYSIQDGNIFIKSESGQMAEFDITSPKERSSIDIVSFFEEYYKSEETSVATDNGLSGETTVLSCYLPHSGEQRFLQKLWIDNKTYLPVKLETYNTKEEAVVTVVYTEFERNCKIENINLIDLETNTQ